MSTPPDVATWREQLTALALAPGATSGVDEKALVDLLTGLEELKAAAAAAQARLAVALDATVRDREARADVPARRRGCGVAAQVALARRESPHRGRVLVGLARDLAMGLPHTFRALAEGRLSEHRAMLVARESGCLEAADRAAVDAAVCGDPDALDGVGTAALVADVRRRTYALDPSSVVRRARRAESERCVTVRPAPDTMASLTVLVPVARAVAAYAALGRAADTLIGTGEAGERGRGQLMADLAVERLTGQARADAVPVTVDLVVSDATLLGAGSGAAELAGWGPVPAQIARELVAASLGSADTCPTWLRQLYADPAGRLVSMTSRSRFAPDGLADFLRVRDQGLCRTPYCDAPARHADHVDPYARGGPTSAVNLRGLCEACNHAAQADGWRASRGLDGDGVIVTETPTGHRHRSRTPTTPSPAAPAVVTGASSVERRVADLVFSEYALVV